MSFLPLHVNHTELKNLVICSEHSILRCYRSHACITQMHACPHMLSLSQCKLTFLPYLPFKRTEVFLSFVLVRCYNFESCNCMGKKRRKENASEWAYLIWVFMNRSQYIETSNSDRNHTGKYSSKVTKIQVIKQKCSSYQSSIFAIIVWQVQNVTQSDYCNNQMFVPNLDNYYSSLSNTMHWVDPNTWSPTLTITAWSPNISPHARLTPYNYWDIQ